MILGSLRRCRKVLTQIEVPSAWRHFNGFAGGLFRSAHQIL